MACLIFRQVFISNFMEIIGRSKQVLQSVALSKAFASENDPCLIIGETGTGKTTFAKFIHEKSHREAENFVVFDALEGPELEKKLFGYVHSNILGIENITPGAIDAAGSGTLLIKNLQAIPLELQPQILATVHLGGYKLVGSEETLKSACRYIFTIPDRPERFIAEKKLLPEIAQLLSRNTIILPPLKKRSEDIELLAHYFVKKWCENLGMPQKQLTKDAVRLLKKSAWDGNVSELQLILLNAVIHFSGNIIDYKHIQLKMDGNLHPHQKEHLEQIALEEIVEKKLSQFMHRLGKFDVENLHGVIIERVERPLIKLAMKKAGNNQLRAAKILGINRNTLRSKLQKLDLI